MLRTGAKNASCYLSDAVYKPDYFGLICGIIAGSREDKEMAIKQINMPSLWASAIVNHEYSLLDKDDIKALNKELLNNDVSFCDCVECSEPFVGLISGAYCELITYSFRV